VQAELTVGKVLVMLVLYGAVMMGVGYAIGLLG